MSAKNLEEPAPLRVWAGAATITGVLVAAFVYVFGYAFDPHLSPGLIAKAAVRLEALRDTRDATRVVLLGRSAFAYETYDEAGLARAAADAGDGNMRFVRIIAQQQSLDALEPLLADIVAARPDVVVLDTPTLLTDVKLKERLELGRMYAWAQLFGHGHWVREWKEELVPAKCAPPEERSARLKHDVDEMVEHWADGDFDSHGRSFARAKRFIHELTDRGVRVALVTSPIDPALEARIHRRTDPELLAGTAELRAIPGVEEWVPPQPRALVDFCDPFHPAPTWRPVFVRWLTDHAAAVVRARAEAVR